MNVALPGRQAVSAQLFADETNVVRGLAAKAKLSAEEGRSTAGLATNLVQAVRKNRQKQGSIDAFMQEYSLSSEEGVVLMCLAEALLRIPDGATADKLIADKIGGKDWQSHIGQSGSLFVNASAWGLMLTGKFIELGQAKLDVAGFLKRLVSRSGEPVIRQAMKQAMRIMGKQFVLGRSIQEALSVAKPLEQQGYRFSYDMLGEAAMTMKDADRYLASYHAALQAVAKAAGANDAGVFGMPSISVKLSALHPRYEVKTQARVMAELRPRVMELALAAKNAGIGLTIDAEEVNRLDLSLELFGSIAADPALKGWDGLGLAVQAYSKRAYPVIEWLAELGTRTGRRLPVRLVKGAYWDTEVKRAQENGYEAYPLFTRKVSTDVSYLACARLMLERRDVFYPQFATHNAQTLAAISVMAGNDRSFEFQRLHGMGEALYDEVVGADKMSLPCRIYAPVGSHEDLLAYLVRRLLENGANTSFVNRLADDDLPIASIIADPVEEAMSLKEIPHPRIPQPSAIFAPRVNSKGLALWEDSVRDELLAAMAKELAAGFTAGPLVAGHSPKGAAIDITSPHDRSVKVGSVVEADDAAVEAALLSTAKAAPVWDALGGAARGDILEKAAELYEQATPKYVALLVREAGKSMDNAMADLREAVDFLRYYAAEARKHFAAPVLMAGPTGERNEMTLHGRGVFACIAPWNFPLAIFTGQVAAALAAGNAVIAKPAEQTPLIAFEAVKLLHKAGVPQEVLALLPGDGARIGAKLLSDPRLSGVAFTGSNETASIINRALANRSGPILPLIAETGGMNAMLMDSSALPEQSVRDVVASAFDSAGQRCSAARLFFIQEDVADKVIPMLAGAMAELRVADPMDYSTDVGPVIDEEARKGLEAHKANMKAHAKLIAEVPLDPACAKGTYVAPAAYELSDLSLLSREVFGPILHVIRFKGAKLGEVCDQINAKGFGLTLGLHTRIEKTVEEVRARMRVGNMYVNRNQIGAVVGAQPFGGEGLSGTGPKAGGPHYLFRFATERVCSVDTTASGGNAALMSMEPVQG